MGCAFVHGENSHKTKLKSHYTVFTAESIAILQAVHYVKLNCMPKSVICTDSMSVLQALQSHQLCHPIITEIRDLLHQLNNANNECIILWIPGHVGIYGNEKADTQAKCAIELSEEETYEVSFQEYIPMLRTACHNYFNVTWINDNRPTNLKRIKHETGNWNTSIRHKRREEIVLSRLRLGHTRLTHSYLLNRESRPMCEQCNVHVTVRHFLLECPLYDEPRLRLSALCHQHGLQMEMSSLLGDSHSEIIDEVFVFLRESGLFVKM